MGHYYVYRNANCVSNLAGRIRHSLLSLCSPLESPMR